MGFRLNFKWGGFSVQFPRSATSVSPFPSSHSRNKSKDDFCFWARLSASSIVYGEAEALVDSSRMTHLHPSSSSLLEHNYLGTRDAKVVARNGSSDDLHEHGIELLNNEDAFAYFSSLHATKTQQFRLLMKNLDALENMFADANAMRLERDIIENLERLGAIHLFNSCLSSTLTSASSSGSYCTTTAGVLETKEPEPVNNIVEDLIIRSGKKEFRKQRRKRALDFGSGMISGQECRDPEMQTSSARTLSRSRNKRQKVAKNEADMATGVKLAAELERIRRIFEEESGQVASFSSWAEAAGIEKVELRQRLHYGLRCRDDLLRSSRSLVVYIARNYWRLGVAFEDLIQAGNMAVLCGAERFDKSRGYKFSTYVQYWIRKYMSSLVAKHARGVWIPGSLSKVINQVQNARKSLCASVGKHPSDCEIAEFTGLSIEKIRSASRCLRVVGSINQNIGDFIGIKFMEIIPDELTQSPEEGLIRQQMVEDIHKLLRGLQLMEQQVLILRFGLDNSNQFKSLNETGKLLSVSKEWVRRIERRALTKLRSEDSLKILSHYMYIQ